MIPYEIAEQVNKEINESVKYRRDIDLYQKPEHWTVAITEGDCEDYALAKRKKVVRVRLSSKIHSGGLGNLP